MEDGNKGAKDYADLDDIRLVVGDYTLTLVYNVCLGGLHNVLSYDPCSGATQNCFTEINAIIEKSFDEVYDSIVVKTGENQYLLNIGVNLMLGPGSLSQQLCDDVINNHRLEHQNNPRWCQDANGIYDHLLDNRIAL